MNDDNSKLRVAVLVSGRGTNLQAIIDAIASGELHAEVALVVCNHSEAGALRRAEVAGVPAEVFLLRDYPSRQAKQRAIAARLEEVGVELIVCAGWDRVFHPEFVERFAGRMVNVHPSLLPAFGGGLHAIEEALRYGVKVTGCTVHFVTAEVDAGPIISQAAVPVLPGDTVETLGERIHVEEHRLLVEAIRLYTEKRLRVDGRVVHILPGR
jgi:phosphoribosylglycinamide formyltransferase-1